MSHSLPRNSHSYTGSPPEFQLTLALTPIARMLGQIGDARAVAHLVISLRETDGSRWDEAARALQKPLEVVYRFQYDGMKSATRAGITLSRCSMVEALGTIGGAQAVAALTTVLKDGEENVSEAAKRSLNVLRAGSI